MPYLETEGAKVFYEVKGDGPPLLLIAGMSSDSNSWQYIQKGLAGRYKLIMFDNRGCGRTEHYSPFQLSDIAQDAHILLDHLGHGQVFLAGHSMGGMIAQEFALNYPERVQKLILASSSPRLSEKARKILYELLEKWENGYDVAEWFRIMYQWLFNPKALSNKKFIDAAIIFALSYPYAQTLEGFRAQVNAITTFDRSDSIQKITHDTLLVSGSDDILIPTEETAQLLDIGGKASLEIIEGAAHTLHAEKPEAFIQIVMAFINDKRIPDSDSAG